MMERWRGLQDRKEGCETDTLLQLLKKHTYANTIMLTFHIMPKKQHIS